VRKPGLWQAVTHLFRSPRLFARILQGTPDVSSLSSDNANNFFDARFRSGAILSANAPVMSRLQTISFKIQIPRVIGSARVRNRLSKKEVKFTRHNVFERDKEQPSVLRPNVSIGVTLLDHNRGHAPGGPTTWENVVCSCKSRAIAQRQQASGEANMILIRNSKRPKLRRLFPEQITFAAPQARSLTNFVDLAYLELEKLRISVAAAIAGGSGKPSSS